MTEQRWRVTASGVTKASWDSAAIEQYDRAMSQWARIHPDVHLSYERHAVCDVFISLNVDPATGETAIALGEKLIREVMTLLPSTRIDSVGALPLKAEPDFT
ncbi:MAG: hypothetical protein QOG02_1476 [Gaiellales bacterium]|jgi:hypothetical protein|nr:hypothetical protein [Gaiellales bacterium]